MICLCDGVIKSMGIYGVNSMNRVFGNDHRLCVGDSATHGVRNVCGFL